MAKGIKLASRRVGEGCVILREFPTCYLVIVFRRGYDPMADPEQPTIMSFTNEADARKAYEEYNG